MDARIVSTIMRKDLQAFSRDRFFAYVTVLGLVAYAIVFWLLPADVNETITIGLHHSEATDPFGPASGAPGVQITRFDTRDELVTAVEEGDPPIGIVLPPGFVADLRAGTAVNVEVVVPADVPEQFRYLAESLVEGISTALGGVAAPEPTFQTTVLGIDRVGDQISLREQMRPLLAFLVLMIETFALASLVAVEIQGRTVTAVLATPATIGDFLAAKALFGTTLAFVEALLLVAVIGGLAIGAPLIVLILVLGAVMVTGLGMIAGSYGRDFLGVLFVSMAFMIPLVIPAFGVLFPGSSAPWVQALPSYGLVDAIVEVTVDGEGLVGIAPSLGLLAAWCVVLFGAGLATLKRRVVAL